MDELKYPTDRMIDSTDNNEFAEGINDENFWDEDLVDVDIPDSDRLPDRMRETGVEDAPLYDEAGYRHLDI